MHLVVLTAFQVSGRFFHPRMTWSVIVTTSVLCFRGWTPGAPGTTLHLTLRTQEIGEKIMGCENADFHTPHR